MSFITPSLCPNPGLICISLVAVYSASPVFVVLIVAVNGMIF